MVYLLDESSSLERALAETQRCLIWWAFASQGYSGEIIMGVRFLMASAACPLVYFAIHLKYVRNLQDKIAQDDAGHTRKLPTMRDGDHKSPSTTTLNANSKF